ncbi:hypothetical protein IscW_ISCW023230, partial [Ixodes scapularis]
RCANRFYVQTIKKIKHVQKDTCLCFSTDSRMQQSTVRAREIRTRSNKARPPGNVECIKAPSDNVSRPPSLAVTFLSTEAVHRKCRSRFSFWRTRETRTGLL